jgi:hypothetical protein
MMSLQQLAEQRRRRREEARAAAAGGKPSVSSADLSLPRRADGQPHLRVGERLSDLTTRRVIMARRAAAPGSPRVRPAPSRALRRWGVPAHETHRAC